MKLPESVSGKEPCVKPDGSVTVGCTLSNPQALRPYPPSPPPTSTQTIFFETGQQKSKYEKNVIEYFLNKRPWQLFHSQMGPILFTQNASALDAPVQGGLPYGSVVDLIIQNTLNETIPMYKHGDTTYMLGSGTGEWKYKSVKDAMKQNIKLDVEHPPLGLEHDLPPLGWLVLRWQVRVRGATMIHSNKIKYYAVSKFYPKFRAG